MLRTTSSRKRKNLCQSLCGFARSPSCPLQGTRARSLLATRFCVSRMRMARFVPWIMCVRIAAARWDRECLKAASWFAHGTRGRSISGRARLYILRRPRLMCMRSRSTETMCWRGFSSARNTAFSITDAHRAVRKKQILRYAQNDTLYLRQDIFGKVRAGSSDEEPALTSLRYRSLLRRKGGRGQVFLIEEVRVGKGCPSITDGFGFGDALRLDDDG